MKRNGEDEKISQERTLTSSLYNGTTRVGKGRRTDAVNLCTTLSGTNDKNIIGRIMTLEKKSFSWKSYFEAKNY